MLIVVLALLGVLALAVLGQDEALLPDGVKVPRRIEAASAPENGSLAPSPHPFLSDIRIRQATAHCTDKDALVAAAYPHLTEAQRAALIMDSFIPPDHWAYTAPSTTYPYSPTLGISLLEQAGWMLPAGGEYRTKDGVRLAMTVKSSDSEMRIAYLSAFEALMKDCGIQVTREHLPWHVWFGDFGPMGTRDFDLGAFAWCGGEDPSGYGLYGCFSIPSAENGWTGQNYMGWCNPDASDLVRYADDTSLTQQERKAHYADFLDLYAQDMPQVALFMYESGTVDRYCWEHIDMNFGTYVQAVQVQPESGAVLAYTDHQGNQGTVSVPAGAVSETVTLTYSPQYLTVNSLPGNWKLAIPFRLEVLAGGVPQDNYAFEEPITVLVKYDDRVFSESSLTLYYWDGTAWQDAYLSCPPWDRYQRHDMTANEFEVNVCHLSEFVLAGISEKVFLPLVMGRCCQEVVLSGLVYNDMNGNGMRDEAHVLGEYREHPDGYRGSVGPMMEPAVAGARVQAGGDAMTTNESGFYSLRVPPGTVTVTVEAEPYRYRLPSVQEIKDIGEPLVLSLSKDTTLDLGLGVGFLTLPYALGQAELFRQGSYVDIHPGYQERGIYNSYPEDCFYWKCTGDAHRGIDYAAPEDTVVVAAAPGQVTGVTVRDGPQVMVFVQHTGLDVPGNEDMGFISSYQHLASAAEGIAVGAIVSRGQPIGYLNQDAHVHFDARWYFDSSCTYRCYVDPYRDLFHDKFAYMEHDSRYGYPIWISHGSPGWWTADNLPAFAPD